ncbi:MAG: CAP domain-containing protein [Sulfitobacter sp.]
MRRVLMCSAMALFLVGCSAGQGPVNDPQSAALAGTTTPVRAQINAIRASAGVGQVKRNAKLDRAALAHARDMAANNFLSHTSSDGSDLRRRVERAGYDWCSLGENVSRGYRSDQAAIEQWRTSPGHYRNMIKGKAREFGMANVNGFRVMVLGASNC